MKKCGPSSGLTDSTYHVLRIEVMRALHAIAQMCKEEDIELHLQVVLQGGSVKIVGLGVQHHSNKTEESLGKKPLEDYLKRKKKDAVYSF